MVELLFTRFRFRVGLFFDFGKDFGGISVRRQLGHNHAPLSACQLLDFVTRTHAHAAFAGFVNPAQFVRRRDDLTAAGKIGRGNILHQVGGFQRRLFQQRNRRLGDFVQIVRRNFSRHTHRDARRAVEQDHGQAGGQVQWLVKRAVVVRHEIHRPLIDFGQQQFRNRRQPRFGITHRRRPVAVARTKVADAVD